MNLLDVIILSIIEGVTEFLPISSTGHLILTSNILGILDDEFVKTFNIVIQLGAILAAVVLYAKLLIKQKDLKFKIMTAFVPAALVGFVLYKFIKGFLLENIYVTLVALVLGGIAFIVLEKFVFEKSHGTKVTLKSMTHKDALIIGLFQSISVIPGVSRAGATIIGGMLRNMNRPSAVEFSFLVAIPLMIAATLYDLSETTASFTSQNMSFLGVGFAVSFAVAMAVMQWFIKYIQNHNFVWFGIYRIVFAILYFLIIAL